MRGKVPNDHWATVREHSTWLTNALNLTGHSVNLIKNENLTIKSVALSNRCKLHSVGGWSCLENWFLHKVIYSELSNMCAWLLKIRLGLKKLRRGEICVVNFIPPANGASLGSYWVTKCCIFWPAFGCCPLQMLKTIKNYLILFSHYSDV